eukprot:3999565-Alexandrium_andersonii.AAC.1
MAGPPFTEARPPRCCLSTGVVLYARALLQGKLGRRFAAPRVHTMAYALSERPVRGTGTLATVREHER